MSDELRDGDWDDSGFDFSSSDFMEDDFDYFEDMNDFWMNGGFIKFFRRWNLLFILIFELIMFFLFCLKIVLNIDL